VLVFSQSATLPLAAYLSHSRPGVTSPHRCRKRLTMLVFPQVEFFAVTGQTDRRTDARPLHNYNLIDAVRGNKAH